jgi:hypothetical protein
MTPEELSAQRVRASAIRANQRRQKATAKVFGPEDPSRVLRFETDESAVDTQASTVPPASGAVDSDGYSQCPANTQASTVPPLRCSGYSQRPVDTQALTQVDIQDWPAFDRCIREREMGEKDHVEGSQPVHYSLPIVRCTAESLLSAPQVAAPLPASNSHRGRPVAFRSLETFNEKDVDVHTLGKLEHVCTKCQALHWEAEATARKVVDGVPHFTFSMCCGDGKVSLPPIKEPPPRMKLLFTADTPQARQFRNHAREYNNVFTFASLKLDRTYVPTTPGICGLSISGRSSFFVGDIVPSSGAVPAWSQVYLLDERDQLAQRCGKTSIDFNTASIIQESIIQCNPFVAKYQAAASALQPGSLEHVMIRIHGDHVPEGVHARTYNAPTNDEIAVIIPSCAEAGVAGVGGDGKRLDYNDIVVHSNSGGRPTVIKSCNKFADPLHFILAFPYGCAGFGYGLKKSGQAVLAAGRTKVYDKLTPMMYYCYRLFTRDKVFSAIHYCQRLFQEYCIVQYCKEEAERLSFVRHNQTKLRAELYQGLCDSVEKGDSGPLGHRVILPATFVGSQRYMAKCYQDSMAIVRAYGKPSLFITFTCNPKWSEITEALYPGQDCVDRPDICSRVFELKLKSLLSDILDKGIFGTAVAHVSVVEYQKRGLPHAHILIILERSISEDDIDMVVSAELPNPVTHEVLHKRVLAHMVHGPCGEQNPNCPCMVNGKCSKNYPKSFCDESTCDDDKMVYRRRSPASGGVTTEKRGKDGQPIKVDNSIIVPYSPYLLMRFDAHINVEVCNYVSCVKYLYKYVCKGADRVTFTAETAAQPGGVVANPEAPPVIDEIKNYQDGRWITSCSATARIFGFPVQSHKPSVLGMAIHVKGGQRCLLQDCNTEEERRQYHARVAASGTLSVYLHIRYVHSESLSFPGTADTHLMAFFKLNASEGLPGDVARELLYHETPRFFAWVNNGWKLRAKNDGMIDNLGSKFHTIGSKAALQVT